MDYKETAKRLIELLGGKDNIISAAHCATRLRLVMKDESKIDQAQVEEARAAEGPFDTIKLFNLCLIYL